MNKDLTCVYYTCNYAPPKFLEKTMSILWKALDGIPLISVSQKPMDFGYNICVGQEIGRSHINIYRQATLGAMNAKTKYVAFVEDDVLYSPGHFDYKPTDGVFAYDMNIWTIYTFVKPPVFSYKNRINFNGLICERDLFIEAMKERFAKWPDDSITPIRNWAEPGKYEVNLGVTVRNKETYMASTPSIAFYHPTSLSYLHLGTRKRLGLDVREELPYWGKASEIIKQYDTQE